MGQAASRVRVLCPQLLSEEVAPAPKAPTASPSKAPSEPKATAAAAKASDEGKATGGTSEATFREAALEKGIHTVAIDALVGIVNEKLGGDFSKGLKTLESKSAEELNSKYAPDTGGQW